MATERGRTTLFVLNQEAHRAALRRAVAGTLTLPQGDEDSTAEPPRAQKRPNVFDLYEQEIGMITPLVADELKSAEADYPREWTETAIREAALSGKRSWPYVRAILRRWEREGKSDGKFGRITKGARPKRLYRGVYTQTGKPARQLRNQKTGARCATVTAGWSAGYPWGIPTSANSSPAAAASMRQTRTGCSVYSDTAA